MKPNVFFSRMDSDSAQDMLLRRNNEEQADAMVEPTNVDWNHQDRIGGKHAVPPAGAISVDYDISMLQMNDPLTALASVATWSENAAAADSLQANLGVLGNTPFDQVTPTVLTKGLIRQMLVNRGALEKEAAAKAAEDVDRINRMEQQVQLTPEQAERRQRRRDRNKAAATRCRQRRREHILELEEDVDHLTAAQKDLEKQVADLLKERQELEEMLARHSCVQPQLLANTDSHQATGASAASESQWDSSDDSSDDSDEEN